MSSPVSGIVHRDLKLENILLGENPDDANDKLHIKVQEEGRSSGSSWPVDSTHSKWDPSYLCFNYWL